MLGVDQFSVEIDLYDDKLGQSGDRILSSHITTINMLYTLLLIL